jgi:hypothetical protein
VLVTGARDADIDRHRQIVWDELEEATQSRGTRFVTVVHGMCPRGGVDLFADQWATDHDWSEAERHPADWDRYGKNAAGPIRNSAMVKLGADLCLAFPLAGSSGTWDCAKKAVRAGIRTIIVPLPD